MAQSPACQPQSPRWTAAFAVRHKRPVQDQLIADTISDARWFPLRYDARSDVMHFAWIPAETHRALTFITDFTPAQLRPLRRTAVTVAPASAPLHIILHSGLGGSTLLARALAQPAVVTTLKEPPILTDVVAFGLRSSDAETKDLLGDVAALLARPFSPGEAVVCKMSSVGNGLSGKIAELRTDTRILCLQTPLEQMLASLASKGAAGRAGARRLFVGLQNSSMACVTLSEAELGEHSDLQLAALAWLSIQKMLWDAAERFGPERVRSLDSEQLFAQPRGSLAAVAGHFRLSVDVEARLASGVFARHAKTGEAYDANKRAVALNKTLRSHGSEIVGIVEWARKTADANGIACDLPYPIFD
jgi:hypothetical protein